MSNDGG